LNGGLQRFVGQDAAGGVLDRYVRFEQIRPGIRGGFEDSREFNNIVRLQGVVQVKVGRFEKGNAV
jgi:hypothetical protein